LIQLRTFVEVYRRRSLSEAARAIGITQPAASQHIASLEAQLGHPLFDRHSRGVRPTAIADDLAASIGGSLDVAEAALAAARARSSRMCGTVHIAAPSDLLGEMITPRLGPLLDAGLDHCCRGREEHGVNSANRRDQGGGDIRWLRMASNSWRSPRLARSRSGSGHIFAPVLP
jgi:DNA-binding transcriptional LysR family regulator